MSFTFFLKKLIYCSELMEQGGKLAEKSEELKLNLKQVYDELRSQIGDVR